MRRTKGNISRSAWARGLVFAAVLALGTLLGQASAAADDLVAEVADTLGFDDAERDRIRAGEIVSRAQEEDEDELSAGLALVIQSPVDAIVDEVVSGEVFKVDRATVGIGEIDPSSPIDALKQMTLPKAQLEALHRASPGSEQNLSEREIERLRAASSDSVLDTYRSLLAERVTAYSTGGFDAIAPYARGGEVSRPGASLEAATHSLQVLAAHAPAFWQSLTQFPTPQGKGVEHQFWWHLSEVEEKPTPVLIHRLFERRADDTLLAERHFYVGSSYNALMIAVGVFALEADRSLVFYRNRTYTDQVAGFGSGARHRIGRAMMIDEVQSFLEAVRDRLEAP